MVGYGHKKGARQGGGGKGPHQVPGFADFWMEGPRSSGLSTYCNCSETPLVCQVATAALG